MQRTWTVSTRFALNFGFLALILLTSLDAQAEDGFALKDSPGESMDILLDGRPIARFMYAYDPENLHDTYKPFLHVLDAEGKAPITKGPGGQFTHHRGVFLGFSRMSVDGKRYDLWHMSGGPQVHQKFIAQEADADHATITSLIAWNTKDGKTLLEEERTMTFRRPPMEQGLVRLDFVSKLTAVSADVILDGDPEHAGMQYRPANEVDKSKTRYTFHADGIDPKKDKDLPWVGETYVLDDKMYSVIHMNHPENPKGTIYSAYRDYGRFGAFPKAEIAKSETLMLRYHICVMTGELPDREMIQKGHQQFAP